jgi:glycerol-3-phosphate acyltransferase PlsY
VPGLEPLRVALLLAVAALSIALAVWPRRKSLVQVAALGAAVIIALQLTATYWFYLYIVWFFPLLLVALTLVEERPDVEEVSVSPRREPASEPARSSQPVHSG